MTNAPQQFLRRYQLRYQSFVRTGGLMTLLFLTSFVGAGQETARKSVFPPDRHRELREEIQFPKPAEEEEEESLAFEPWTFEAFDLPPAAAYAIIGVMLLLLGGLVYRMLGDVELRKRTRSDGDGRDEIKIEEIEEEALVASGVSLSLQERAEKAGQFDIAVRLLYIQLLKDLRDRGLIKYRRDYSNRDYQAQLSQSALLGDFRGVTVDYERFWYGKYVIDALSYRLVKRKFSTLTGRVESTKQAPSINA
ncbi:hypothetical protein [Neolewinella antarctica]|uniref:DUF4129 domain-containing protein n=1 Tax=Neolewinella antarctica TaxID=442734 RepID=A0ABX0XF25_9BACT|nr:hypothetical protein [Neolewinella antarctica]NJC27923.1 hypothetical protein [Neolewinella antarctica]